MNRLGIDGVAEVCHRMRALSRGLFEVVGDWVASTDDPKLQRTFAVASHRHAWHAQLWAARLPSIPGAGAGGAVPVPLDPAAPDRAAAHRAAIDQLLDELGDLADRIDPELDPSTRRTIDLVAADLGSIRAELR